MILYRISRATLIVILRVFFRLRVEGRENIPQKTNFIVVANHTSFLDPLVIAAAVPREISWIAMRGVYNVTALKWFMRATAALPTGNASQKAVYLLNNNKHVGLFPEGTRSRDGKLRDFRRGAALIAVKTGRPILPCVILGAYEAYPRGARFPRLFLPITVKIGKPKYLLKEFCGQVDDISLQEGIFKIKNAMKEMVNNA